MPFKKTNAGLLFCCRYASLYFCCAIEDQDNELITLEIIHRYVELLDKYFGSVRFFCILTSLIIIYVLYLDWGNIMFATCWTNTCHTKYFLTYAQQVCELDIIFNFEKAYFILDEFLLGGEAQETSKKNVLKAIEQADLLQEVRHWMKLQWE